MQTNEAQMRALDLNQQGVVLFKAGNIEAAMAKHNKAIDVEPMVMDSYKNIGDLYLRTGEYSEAKNYYKKALLIEKSGVVYFQYGNACFMNDEPHEGLEYYNLALSAGYDSDEMFFFMGMAYEHMNDDKMALRYIQKAIMKNPSRPDYKVKKVSVLLRLNMIDDAKETVDEILLNEPELYDGYHMKTAIYVEEEDFEKAVEFAKSASDRFPEDVDLFYDYVNAVTLSGDYDKAIKLVGNAKKMKYFEPAKSRFTLLEAQLSAELGEIENAISKCEECIAMETGDDLNEDARFMLINLALTKPDYESALVQAETILEKNRKNSVYFAALYFRPFCLKQLGRGEDADHFYKEAISLYRMATLSDPEAFDAYLYRVMCLRDSRQYEDALELLEFLETLSDEIAEIYTIRADIYKLNGNKAFVQAELDKAYALKPELKETLSEGGK